MLKWRSGGKNGHFDVIDQCSGGDVHVHDTDVNHAVVIVVQMLIMLWG